MLFAEYQPIYLQVGPNVICLMILMKSNHYFIWNLICGVKSTIFAKSWDFVFNNLGLKYLILALNCLKLAYFCPKLGKIGPKQVILASI